MAAIFISYSGRNIEPVKEIVNFIQAEIGRDHVWFAPDQYHVEQDVFEQISAAIYHASIVVNVVSPETVSLFRGRSRKMKRENLSDQLLRYERELAIHLRKSIINVVLNGPVKMPVEFAKYPLVRIVEPTNSLINMNAMRTLIELLRGVESEQEV